MTKKHRQHKHPSQPTKQLEAPTLPKELGDQVRIDRRPRLATALNVLAILLSILGILLWLPSFWPRILITNTASFDPSDLFQAPFSISNQGLASVTSMQFSCRLNEIRGIATLHDLPMQIGFVTSTLRPGDIIQIFCPLNQLIGGIAPITNANVDIVVAFSPPIIHHRLTVCANFTSFADHQGRLHWMQLPEPNQNRCQWPPT